MMESVHSVSVLETNMDIDTAEFDGLGNILVIPNSTGIAVLDDTDAVLRPLK